ncbi:YbaB/EbfC family nucleoid-associated protein [Nonomuraea sp. M3C6]|uniref:YbaB/EbfC family nucleoid-associated protein n=1 Tax=Nonomuraea marmarensis TaxID=3351344 RepID=A0ABW7AA42_9ACTN
MNVYDSRMDPADIRDEDISRAEDEADRIETWINRARADLDELKGTGESPSGTVTATVAANGRVLDVAIAPRAMRLDSQTLSEEVLAAVAQAGQDVTRRTEELIREGLPGFDPAAATARMERIMNTEWP